MGMEFNYLNLVWRYFLGFSIPVTTLVFSFGDSLVKSLVPSCLDYLNDARIP